MAGKRNMNESIYFLVNCALEGRGIVWCQVMENSYVWVAALKIEKWPYMGVS